MVYTWDCLQQYHFNPPVGRLRRTSSIKRRYNDYQAQINNAGVTVADIVKEKHFKGLKPEPFYVITRNDFPYNVADGIFHYLMWFNPNNKYPLYDDFDYVGKVLDSKIGPGRYVCFMNPASIQSVPEIKHYQIFFR